LLLAQFFIQSIMADSAFEQYCVPSPANLDKAAHTEVRYGSNGTIEFFSSRWFHLDWLRPLRVFTKVLALIAAHVHTQGAHVFPCLDDWLMQTGSLVRGKTDFNLVFSTLVKAGWLINWGKSNPVSAQERTFLGGRFRAGLNLVMSSFRRNRLLSGLCSGYSGTSISQGEILPEAAGVYGSHPGGGSVCPSLHEAHPVLPAGLLGAKIQGL
jgi:hypothetical protein